MAKGYKTLKQLIENEMGDQTNDQTESSASGLAKHGLSILWAAWLLLAGTNPGLAQETIAISQQPADVTTSVGKQIQTMAVATGPATGYQWYKDGQPLVGKAGAKLSALLSYNSAVVTNTGDYYAVFTNSSQSVTSRVARVYIVPPGPPLITKHPQSTSITENDFLLLSGTAIGSGGTLSYQWLREGTNIGTGISSLRLNAPDPNRFGRFQLVATMTPGGSTTSEVAVVTLKSDTNAVPPLIAAQPTSVTGTMGSDVALSVVVEGTAAVTFSWYRSNEPVWVDGPIFPVYPLLTNSLSIQRIGPLNAGPHWVVVANQYGASTSAVAVVSYTNPPPAQIVQDLADVEIGIGQYQRTNLLADLVQLRAGNQKSLLISLAVDAGSGGLSTTGHWDLALGPDGRFTAGGDGFAPPSQGTWGTNTALLLTNLTGVGGVASVQWGADGKYVLQSPAGTQTGRYFVPGPRRPAMAVFTLEISSSNTFTHWWHKDGIPMTLPWTPSQATPYEVVSLVSDVPGIPGPVNRYQLVIPDVTPLDEGTYHVVITNTAIYGALQGGGVFSMVTSVDSSRPAKLSVLGWGETNAPQVLSAAELSSTANDDVTALSVLPDGSSLLGLRWQPMPTTLEPRGRLLHLAADGSTNWMSGQLTLPAAQGEGIRGTASDGEGGAFIGGTEENLRYWFLRRLRPYTVVSGGVTNVGVTNAWTRRVFGPAENPPENTYLGGDLADVVKMLPTPDGLVVAGHFRGRIRFGALPVNDTDAPALRPVIGGIVLTNQSESTRDIYLAKYDRTGALVWIRQLGTSNDDEVTSLVSNGTGELALGGAFEGTLQFAGKAYSSTSVTNPPSTVVTGQDGFVARFSAEGTPLWFQAIGGTDIAFIPETKVDAVALDSKGRVYFAASRPEGRSYLRPGIYTEKAFLGFLDAVGSPVWAQPHNGTSADGATLLEVDGGDNVILADRLTSIAALDTLPTTTGTTLAKFSPDGRLLWIRSLDTPSPNAAEPRPASARHMGRDGLGRLVLAGQLPARPGVGQSPSLGQRFDDFELLLSDFVSGDALDTFVVRLAAEGGGTVAEPAVLRFTLPQPGMLTLRLEWPSGYKLQRVGALSGESWETLDVSSPYDADPRSGPAAFYRVMRK